jgi:hypothetical protein
MVVDPTRAGRTLTPDVSQPGASTQGIGVVQENAIGATQTKIANGVFNVGAALSLVFCLVLAARQRRMLPLYIFVGSCLAVPVEMFVDVLGRCSWATLDQPIIANLMGRNVPLLNLTNYMVYFPGAIVAIHAALEKGLTLRQWWKFASYGILLAWLFELYPVHAHWWYYYGEGQPLELLGLPLWWGPVAVLAVLGASGLTFVIRHRVLQDRHTWLLMPAIPLAVISTHMTASFPTFVALSSTDKTAITSSAALLTIAVALAMIHLIGTFVASDQVEPSAESANDLPLPRVRAV